MSVTWMRVNLEQDEQRHRRALRPARFHIDPNATGQAESRIEDLVSHKGDMLGLGCDAITIRTFLHISSAVFLPTDSHPISSSARAR